MIYNSRGTFKIGGGRIYSKEKGKKRKKRNVYFIDYTGKERDSVYEESIDIWFSEALNESFGVWIERKTK